VPRFVLDGVCNPVRNVFPFDFFHKGKMTEQVANLLQQKNRIMQLRAGTLNLQCFENLEGFLVIEAKVFLKKNFSLDHYLFERLYLLKRRKI
jgi:hypothetical protein